MPKNVFKVVPKKWIHPPESTDKVHFTYCKMSCSVRMLFTTQLRNQKSEHTQIGMKENI